MSPIAVAFWGAFTCTVTLVLVGALGLLLRGMRRAAFSAFTAAAVPMLTTLAFLGWLSPDEQDARDRYLSMMAVGAGIALSLMLLALLGGMRRRRSRPIAVGTMLAAGAVTAAAVWALPPYGGLILGCAFDWIAGLAILALGLRQAGERRRMALLGVAGVLLLLTKQAGLAAYALTRGEVGWPVHALAASAGVIYLVIVACGLGLRVIRSIELQEVLALGPTYDPVTRMASYSEAGKVTAAYFRSAGAAQVVGVMAISLANLPALENLHGRAAHNHALFVCASRLRNCAPAGAQLCRLGEDGFLMLMLLRSEEQLVLLTEVAHRIRRRLLRAIDLSLTGESPEAPHTEWTAELGIGIALSNAELAPGSAVAAARAASRSAWGFPSRIAVCEEAATGFMELPLDSRPR